MRHASLLVVLLFAGYGCNSSPDSDAARRASVTVSYLDGFRGDSLLLLCDGDVVERSRVFSDSVNVPSGFLFTVNEGVHVLQIRNPELNMQSDTTFRAIPAYRTIIDASFNRHRKIFSCSIRYVDTNEASLPYPPSRSVQSMMPR